ncbi:ADAMTS-like protein 2 isoform X1 [Ananas comosus]|uniref:ADAMTS-like protein 2 isoform X1 n=2 Tax=Ananas comosus TaxID=4615 RepID=A0A6P5GLN9_ANACO|nr:ADAMTS-like protein 2 isoform X1 [Ananas comosus]CAD1823925.1 unnamed protein product [Ananas comosus var. bracteatus]
MAALLIYYSLLPFFALASSLDLPSHGCYWTECQSKWFGGCSSHFSADLSDNCNGLCGESDSPPCLPFHTHFHCCIPETPKVTNRCGRCNNKLDFGEEYICCTDCSEPYIMDKASKLGYCKSGAQLAMQLKPQETFKWVSGPWMKCSAPCDGGVRYRDVACFGSTAGTSVKQYPVDDARCSLKDMPPRQEACNLQRCVDFSISESTNYEKRGVSGWFIALIVLLGLVAVGGIAFAGYTYYKRRTSTSSGFVYIMMEGYS